MIITLFTVLWIYANSLIGVNSKSKEFLNQLKSALVDKGYRSNYFVISGRRWKLDNYILNQFGGAAKNSRHLKGEAMKT